MINIILTMIIALICGSAVFYIYKTKKSGKTCIGCPDSGSCNISKKSCRCCCAESNRKIK